MTAEVEGFAGGGGRLAFSDLSLSLSRGARPGPALFRRRLATRALLYGFGWPLSARRPIWWAGRGNSHEHLLQKDCYFFMNNSLSI